MTAPTSLRLLNQGETNQTTINGSVRDTQRAVSSSAALAKSIGDGTGSGALTFATSPTLAGTPLAPTAAVATNTTQIATTAFVLANQATTHAAGSDTQVQFNDGGTNFGANSGFTYNKTTHAIAVAGQFSAGDKIVPAAGTTAIAPIVFQSGTNLTTATAGAVEYDGKVLMFDHAASARGVVSTEMFSINASDFTLAADNSTQTYLTAGAQTLTVLANTTYFFRTDIYLTTGTTTHTVGFLLGGTATFTDVLFTGQGGQNVFDAGLTSAEYNATKTPGTAMVLTGNTNKSDANLSVGGHFRTNAAGTIIPRIQFSANPGGTNLSKTGTYFRCWPAGTDVVASLGNWS